jgi:hypothetical protein
MWIVIIVVVIVGVLATVLGTRHAKSYKASANDIPKLVERLKAGTDDPRFAAFVFGPGQSNEKPDYKEAVNLQYSVENGEVGFDWVLIMERNIADKDEIVRIARQMGLDLKEQVMNDVKYLRVESPKAAELGMKVIRDFYGIDPDKKLDLVVEGFEWEEERE